MTAPATPSNVKLPAAAQRQVDAAAAAIAALNAAPGDAAAAQILASAVARGDGSRPTREPAATPPPPDAAAATPGSQPPPAATEVPPAPSIEEQLRVANARYSALQGKYNSETAELRARYEETNMMARDLLAARTAPTPAAVPPAAALSPEDFLKTLGATDGDIKDYGELLPIVVRLAQNMYNPTLQKLQTEVDQLRASATRAQTASVEDRKQAIWDELDEKLPAWRLINESDHFLDWLRIVDIFSGVTRHVALASAFKNLDRARVVGIFQAYAREYPDVARAPDAPLVDPATLVAPPVRGDQPPAAPEGSGSKKIWTEAEIRHFYTRVRKKLVSTAEYKQFQDDIAAATREGRVAPERPDFHANAR